MNLKLARVVAIHPKSQSVDVVVMDDGRRIAGVKVMSSGGSDFGTSDLSEPTQTGYEAKNSGARDVQAVLAWVSGVPVIMGFLRPTNNQMSFDEKGRMVYRHGSDAYLTIDAAGNAEFAHPSGAYIRIGEDPEHEDLSGKDHNKKWAIRRNTDKQVNVRVSNGAFTLTVDPSGGLTIDAVGATLNTDVAVNGNMVVSGDVVASGISLVNHVHPETGAKTNKPE